MGKPVRSTTATWLRRTIILAGLLECAMFARASAQATELPFDVGERLHYRVSLGRLGTVGEAEMSVDGPEAVRGTETLVLRSQVSARVGFVKTTERAQSCIDPNRMTALDFPTTPRCFVVRRCGPPELDGLHVGTLHAATCAAIVRDHTTSASATHDRATYAIPLRSPRSTRRTCATGR